MLNALGAPAPTDPIFAPYPYFTQTNVLGTCALDLPSSYDQGETLSIRFIGMHGATLDEWRAYLSCHAPTVRAHASEYNAAAFRDQARAALEASPPSAVGINFHRSGLGEVGGGHMSPLAAYDAPSDQFLLLDVSRYKYPAVWVRTETLFGAMNTTDGAGGLSRGWVIVSPPASGAGASNATSGAVSAPAERPSREEVRNCMLALASPSDAYGVLACMAEPQWTNPTAREDGLLFVGLGCLLGGALITLGLQCVFGACRRRGVGSDAVQLVHGQKGGASRAV
jgi:hypothetical protein